MTSHRRSEHLTRWRARQPAQAGPSVQPPGVELVDGLTQVKHRVSTDELVIAGRIGACTALCAMHVVVASPSDPGNRRCSTCAS